MTQALHPAAARRVLVIGGPTASGKSGLALGLAEAFDGVIINADSMQIYAGLPRLTAQPAADDLRRAPHRLYNTLAAQDACTSARWRDLALAEIAAAHSGGKLPIIVGGTGFYIKTLLDGISPIPDVPAEYRARALALQKELGNPAFHEELKKRDPATAANLDPFNTQRNVRAWEVLDATGQGLSAWQALPREKPPANLRFITLALLPPRDILYASCNSRFTHMLAAGALDEAKAFQAETDGRTDIALAKALGYPELCAHINGTLSLTEAIEQAQANTRQYAKRQVTWFRHQMTADITLERPDISEACARLQTF